MSKVSGTGTLLWLGLSPEHSDQSGPNRSTSSARGEQVHHVAVGVFDTGVSLAPERVPGLLLAVVTGVDELLVGLVDMCGAVTQEGEADAVTARRLRPLWSERADR